MRVGKAFGELAPPMLLMSYLLVRFQACRSARPLTSHDDPGPSN